jgi:hypothetical protein
MITRFKMTRDINGFNGFGRKFSNTNYQALLSGNVIDTLVIPPTQDATYTNIFAIFNYQPGSPVWVSINNTVAIPTGSFTQVTAELNPEALYLKSGDSVSFITSDATCEVGVALYAVA